MSEYATSGTQEQRSQISVQWQTKSLCQKGQTMNYDDKIKRLENKCENLKQRVRELEKQTKIDRCGDCRHFVMYDGCNQIDYPMEKDDYCSLFQRKKGADDE